MGIGENLNNITSSLQLRARNSITSTTHKVLRLVSGFFIGLVLSLIIQELAGSGQFMMVFLNVLIVAIIYKILSRFLLFQILIFDLICVLVAALLRMYIMIAP